MYLCFASYYVLKEYEFVMFMNYFVKNIKIIILVDNQEISQRYQNMKKKQINIIILGFICL